MILAKIKYFKSKNLQLQVYYNPIVLCRTLTGWCNNLNFPEYGKSIRAFTRLLVSKKRIDKNKSNIFTIRFDDNLIFMQMTGKFAFLQLTKISFKVE